MRKNEKDCYYSDYLMLPQLLSSQKPVSKMEDGKAAHDETLFIIVHQVYELWFKQILHEIKSIQKTFNTDIVPESSLGLGVSRLNRINSIAKVLIEQLHIISTMTPLDFLDFRDYLVPASGFQSVQFREFEIRLGLEEKHRVKFDQKSFRRRLSQEDQKYLENVENEPSLLRLLEAWLERMPYINSEELDFWTSYQKSVEKMLENDEKIIRNLSNLPEHEMNIQLGELNHTRKLYESLFNEEEHQKLIESGQRKLSRKAMLSALFISLYREHSLMHTPFALLSSIINLDENITTWRYRHALFAQKMLGTKIGTGGSSGHQYLKATTFSNRIFTDLFNLSSFLIPKSMRPDLPKNLVDEMKFNLELKN